MPLLVGRPRHEKELMDKLKLYTRDHNWIKANYKQLMEEHGKKYIAVKNQHVVYFADTTEDLVSLITDNDDITRDYAIEYLTDEECTFIF